MAYSASSQRFSAISRSLERVLPLKILGGKFVWRARPIRTHLVALVAVVLLPMLCLAAFLGIKYANAQRQAIEAQRFDLVNNLVFALDKEIEATKTLLRALASSPDLRAGNIEGFRSYAQAAGRTRNLDALVLTDRSGQQIASTLVPLGQPLPKLIDRMVIEEVFAGNDVVSDVSGDSKHRGPSFNVSVPVYEGDSILYALSAEILVDKLNGLFAEAGLKAHWSGCVVDRQGRFVARSRDPSSLGHFAQRELVQVALGRDRAGTFDSIINDGILVSKSFQRSSASGWTAFVAVPKHILDAPLRWTFITLSLSTTWAIAFAIGLASLLARRLAEPVNGLKSCAEALIDGKPTGALPKSEVIELDEVGKAFTYAAAIAAERRALQDRLRLSEERLTQAVAVAALGIFQHDHKADEIEYSPALREMFGFGATEQIRMDTWMDRIVADDRSLVVERIARAHDPAGDGSCFCEFRIVHPTRGIRWLDGRSQTFFEEKGAARYPVQTIGAVRDVTDRKRAEDHLHFVMRELSHRSKNLLAIVLAMAKQTARSAMCLDDFLTRFTTRLEAVAASHDLLTSQNWAGAPVRMLIRRQLELLDEVEGSRLEYHGPDAVLSPAAAQAIGLALHELTTNCIKYGAFSQPTGKVTVTWAFEPVDGKPDQFRLTWQESGGPPVKPPMRKGFGHVVIEEMMAHSLGGEVLIDFAPRGLVWTLFIPARHIMSERNRV